MNIKHESLKKIPTFEPAGCHLVLCQRDSVWRMRTRPQWRTGRASGPGQASTCWTSFRELPPRRPHQARVEQHSHDAGNLGIEAEEVLENR